MMLSREGMFEGGTREGGEGGGERKRERKRERGEIHVHVLRIEGRWKILNFRRQTSVHFFIYS